jgi:hypothetical protein
MRSYTNLGQIRKTGESVKMQGNAHFTTKCI